MVTQTTTSTQHSQLARMAIFAYGVMCYAVFFLTFSYFCGFVGNFLVPRSIDSAPLVPLGSAVMINLGLIALFGVQHSVMARKGFKRWWTQFVPKPMERSTYVLFSSLCLLNMFYFWQPIGGNIWHVTSMPAVVIMYTVFAIGWLTVLGSSFLLNHFDLFGLRQVWLCLRGQEYTPMKFTTPMLYKFVRHPLYCGLLLAFWVTPRMTMTHLVFAVATTAYILLGSRFEEKDLKQEFGEAYAEYQRRVPMLIPMMKPRGGN
ncbi:isoprenylcysteine carboxylmethyltransferase family protein [filamentous cyanobacterium LEGE 11480]|uniref:methanethiol S-methyltransferase n=1 Tax=Romeriopsis navalis LEGE 11480 TaxID=2777977 RepID=A0A928VMN9_9CYAN|nr:methanethiol S-methyltransferase [Romeriopsis navalis]MBE9029320.1 isoprenylcysteine carboxylmethyltransferase family protein [Romeriopsis navalis LEGE 11480]